MIKPLSAAAPALLGPALLGLGLLAAGPASAATSGTPSGVGYLASPKAFHSARVALRVPTVACTTGRSGSVRYGLFVTVRANGTQSPVSLTVDVSCRSGVARYSSPEAGDMHIHHGDHVILRLSGRGANSFSIEDRTTGEAEGGGGVGPGPQPRAERHVLIGARVVGRTPSVRAMFAGARVDGHPLAHVTHRRTDPTRVTALKGSDFRVRSGAG